MSSPPPTDISSIFGEVLRRYRMHRNVSQEELAYLANVDRTFISRLERGVRQPTITTLIGIGIALEVPSAHMVREVEAEYLKQIRVDSRAFQKEAVREKSKRYSGKKKRPPAAPK
jgi:transcriptional regulator with XRE-family HTH domain